MSMQLAQAVRDAGPEEVARCRDILLLAADVAALNDDPCGALYRALIDDLDAPALTYRADLVAAATKADRWVEETIFDLLAAAQDDPSRPLAFALARELGAAARISRDLRAGFARELAADDAVPPQ